MISKNVPNKKASQYQAITIDFIVITLSSCPRDHSIEIVNGNYGRFTITLCNNKVTIQDVH